MNGASASVNLERPTWRQALVMLGGGAVLASSACYGVFANESNDPLAMTFSALFVAGMVLALVGVIMVIVRSSRMTPATDALPRPAWPQVLIMLASGVALGATSCVGFLGTMGKRAGDLMGPFATGFYIGCLVALGGLIMALIRVVRSLRKSLTKNV